MRGGYWYVRVLICIWSQKSYKDAACYKNPENPSSIDLILTNNPRSFQNSSVIETGLSDFHRMVVNVIKTSFARLKRRVINYRDHKSFENKLF